MHFQKWQTKKSEYRSETLATLKRGHIYKVRMVMVPSSFKTCSGLDSSTIHQFEGVIDKIIGRIRVEKFFEINPHEVQNSSF